MQLFCREGFHATGIDAVVKASGVAKMTLYRYFKSKDELILAAVRRHDEQFRHWFMTELESRAQPPAERLLLIFDLVGECVGRGEFCGCPFILASGEFSEPGNPIHAAAVEHKRLMHRYVSGIAAAAGAEDPDNLATQLCLLAEGVLVRAQLGSTDGAPIARAAADTLIRHALSDAAVTAAR